jgi:hypothetical protein
MDRSNDPRFYASPTVDELIAQQGKGPPPRSEDSVRRLLAGG